MATSLIDAAALAHPPLMEVKLEQELKLESDANSVDSVAPVTSGETQPSTESEPEVDYSKIYESLQERFNKVYSVSQKLFVTEKTQRQTMYHYKRRNDALLDLLNDLDNNDAEDLDVPADLSAQRLSNIVSSRPELGNLLDPLLRMSRGDDAKTIKVKDSCNVDLAVSESIPDIVNDELDTVEVNPQDTEMWTRRNYAHLVVSKFRPVEIRGKGVREYINSPTLNTKRRKKLAAKE